MNKCKCYERRTIWKTGATDKCEERRAARGGQEWLINWDSWRDKPQERPQRGQNSRFERYEGQNDAVPNSRRQPVKAQRNTSEDSTGLEVPHQTDYWSLVDLWMFSSHNEPFVIGLTDGRINAAATADNPHRPLRLGVHSTRSKCCD